MVKSGNPMYSGKSGWIYEIGWNLTSPVLYIFFYQLLGQFFNQCFRIHKCYISTFNQRQTPFYQSVKYLKNRDVESKTSEGLKVAGLNGV